MYQSWIAQNCPSIFGARAKVTEEKRVAVGDTFILTTVTSNQI